MLPSDLLSPGTNFTLGDKLQALIIIVCGLTIAYDYELKRENIQLVDFSQLQHGLDELVHTPLQALQDLSSEFSKVGQVIERDLEIIEMDVEQLTALSTQEEREDRIIDMLISDYIDDDVEAGLVKAFGKPVIDWLLQVLMPSG